MTQMASRKGPAVSLSCHGCRYHEQERYRCQGDTGYDHSCTHPDGPDGTWEPAQTPDGCPFHPAHIARELEVSERNWKRILSANATLLSERDEARSEVKRLREGMRSIRKGYPSGHVAETVRTLLGDSSETESR